MNERDRGFTLVEMLIAVVIMALILAAISSAMIVAFRTITTSQQGVTDTSGAQLLVSYFTADAQGADSVQPSDFQCGTSPLIELRSEDADRALATKTSIVYNVAVQPGGGSNLTREVYQFAASATTCPSVPITRAVLISALDPVATTLDCDGSATCTDMSRSIGLKVTASLVAPNTPTGYSPYSFVVTGTRRTS